METIIFGKDEKTKEISLDVLKKTLNLADPYTGKLPESRPMEHYQFIETIAEMAYKNNLKFEMEPIYIGKGESDWIKELDRERLGLPESYIIRRVITKLNISSPGYLKEDFGTSIAVGYNEKGVQGAIGVNVRICSNMCIFGGRLMTTYGNNRMPFSKLMELISKQINELPTIAESDFRILETYKEFPINDRDIIETIGEMHVNAVQGAYFGGNSPLNIGQVSNFTQGVLKSHPKLLELGGEERLMSLYDFYNMGTEILHPKRAEVSGVWPGVAHWGDYINQRFNIN
jgi:hypothetical protein